MQLMSWMVSLRQVPAHAFSVFQIMLYQPVARSWLSPLLPGCFVASRVAQATGCDAG